jgi:hypothetical protein
MKWEVREVEDGWGIFLLQKYCKTDEPVCYGVSRTKSAADITVKRMNNPLIKEGTSGKERKDKKE